MFFFKSFKQKKREYNCDRSYVYGIQNHNEILMLEYKLRLLEKYLGVEYFDTPADSRKGIKKDYGYRKIVK